MVEIERCWEPITPVALEEVEQSFGVRFPEDYREFLLKQNGGFPEPDTFDFQSTGKANGSSIDIFYGISSDDPGLRPWKDWRDDNDIRAVNLIRANRLPSGFIAIGGDPGSNEICICCVPGPNYGKVYFWDQGLEADPAQGETPDTVENVFLIANSFSEFLNGLYKFQLASEGTS